LCISAAHIIAGMAEHRIDRYAPVIRQFAARQVFFHAAAARFLGMHVSDLKGLRLLENGPLPADALSREMGITRSATTALVDRLETAGYVVRVRGATDRRKVFIHVVPAKLHWIARAYAGQKAAMTELLATYTPEEFEAIVDFLKKTTVILAQETQRLSTNSGDSTLSNTRSK
jgi:DNA-binding MarR family transcriptional regulator